MASAVSMRMTALAPAAALCRRIAEQLEHLRHMGDVFLADLLRLRVGLRVVIAIGKTKAAGIGERDDRGGIGVVLIGAEVEEHAARVERQVLTGQESGQILRAISSAAICCSDGIERRGAGLLDCGFIHAGGEEIADLLLIGSARGAAFAGLLQQAPEEELIFVGQLAVNIPARLVGGNRIVFDPGAAAYW